MENKVLKYKISFFDEFKCTGKECSMNCCKGWRVPIDNDTYMKYISEKGLFGLKLQCSIQKKDGVVSFRRKEKGCPFWNKEHLCDLQINHGLEYVPKVCIEFPRRKINYGFLAEESLYLSCPAAGELFLQNLDNLSYISTKEEVDYQSFSTNDDEKYLNELLEIRDSLIGKISDKSSKLWDVFSELVEIAEVMREAVINGIALADVTDVDVIEKNDKSEKTQESSSHENFCIDALRTDKILTGGFYHPLLKRNSPILYKILKTYFNNVDKMTVEEANKWILSMKKLAYTKIENLDKILRGYFIYYLQTSFLEVFEDYSFRKNLVIGIIHVHLLELFMGIYSSNRKSHEAFTDLEIAQLICAYERRARHNEDILKSFI